jgi:sugar phosphate isomerase/epimerase
MEGNMKPKKKPRISIGSWAYAVGPYADNPMSLEEVCSGLNKLGFDGIELGAFKPHAHPDLYPEKKDRMKLVELLEKYGLGVPAISADLWEYPFAEGDPQILKGYGEMFDRHLELCLDCGIKTIRVDTLTYTPFPDKLDYAETWELVIETFRQDADKAADLNMEVIWEFEPGFIFNKPEEIVNLIREVDRGNFTALYDTSHARMCAAVGAKQTPPVETLPGEEMDLLEMLKGRIGHVHLIDSDNTLYNNETSTHTPFGDGVVDFDRMLPAIVDAGYDSEWWSIDLYGWTDAWSYTERCKNWLDSKFTELGWV